MISSLASSEKGDQHTCKPGNASRALNRDVLSAEVLSRASSWMGGMCSKVRRKLQCNDAQSRHGGFSVFPGIATVTRMIAFATNLLDLLKHAMMQNLGPSAEKCMKDAHVAMPHFA